MRQQNSNDIKIRPLFICGRIFRIYLKVTYHFTNGGVGYEKADDNAENHIKYQIEHICIEAVNPFRFQAELPNHHKYRNHPECNDQSK